MSFKLRRQISIKTRCWRTSFAGIGVFVLIALSLYPASRGVQITIDQIVEDRLQQVVENSQSSRDFGLLHVRLSVFQNTFYGNDQVFEKEGNALHEMLKKLQVETRDPHLKKLLEQLQKQFSIYLDRCEWINYLLAWRSGQDSDINEMLLFLQEIIVERTIEVTLEGGEVDYLEQLVLLISGCRESLFEIAKLNAEEDRSLLLAATVADPFPLHTELRSLALRLQTLTASEPPINRFGRQLISRFAYYQYLMRLYQLEMIQFGQQNQQLDQLTIQILSAMQQFDYQTAGAAIESRADIKNIIAITVTTVLGLLGFLSGVFWIAQRNLFRKHIQVPMDLVSERLEKFQQGDHRTLLRLGRNDEWEKIEEIFNKMLSTHQESVSALRESEKRYREIFTNATEGIFRSTIAGRFLELNPAAIAMLGYASAEEAVADFSDLRHQLYQDPQAREQMLEQLYEQKKILNYETVIRRKNGDFFWASVNNYLIHDDAGKILYIEGTFRDISVHKAAQKSLQQLQIYLQNIIDSMPAMLIGVDIDMRVTLWNKRAEQENILSADEVKGLFIHQVCRLFDFSVCLPKLAETLRTRKPTRLLKVESIKRAKDDSRRFFDILIYPLSMTEVSGAVIHIDDISERVQLEEMMVRSKKMQSVGSLASGLAHEINNPLAAILQSVQVLSRRLSPDLAKNRETAQELGTTIETIVEYNKLRGCEKMLQSITSAGQRAAKIVENMQSFSRRSSSDFVYCSLSELLERTIELAGSDYDMRYHFDFHKIQIIREYRSVPDVYCETSQIQQVILSLLKNAAQALSGQTDDPQIILKILPSGKQHVCLQIEDNGPGMEEELSKRIFDPFYTTRDVGRGTGLGLSIAYFIVNQNHQGSLSVFSKLGQGSRFDMILPVDKGVEISTLYPQLQSSFKENQDG